MMGALVSAIAIRRSVRGDSRWPLRPKESVVALTWAALARSATVHPRSTNSRSSRARLILDPVPAGGAGCGACSPLTPSPSPIDPTITPPLGGVATDLRVAGEETRLGWIRTDEASVGTGPASSERSRSPITSPIDRDERPESSRKRRDFELATVSRRLRRRPNSARSARGYSSRRFRDDWPRAWAPFEGGWSSNIAGATSASAPTPARRSGAAGHAPARAGERGVSAGKPHHRRDRSGLSVPSLP